MNHHPISLNKSERANLRASVMDKKKLFFEGINSQPIPLQIHQTPVIKNGNPFQIMDSPIKIATTTRNSHKHTQSTLPGNNYHTGSQRVLSFKDSISQAENIHNSPDKFDINPQCVDPSLQRKLSQLFFKVEKLELKYEHHEHQIKAMKAQFPSQFDIKNIIQQFKTSKSGNLNSNSNIQALKRQIDSLRKQLGVTSFKNQVSRKFTKNLISKQNRSLQTQVLKTSEKLLQVQKKQIQNLTHAFQQSMLRYQQNNSKKVTQLQKIMHSIQSIVNIFDPVPSLRNKYHGKGLTLKYLQKFTVENGFQRKQIIINEMTYKIDNQGYLLDQQNRYLLNYKGQQIRLEPQHLILLAQNKMLRFH